MNTVRASFLTAVFSSILFDPVAAAMPATYRVTYSIREAPTDPDSPVIWTVALDLTAISSGATAIGWRIDRATLTQLEVSPQRSWIKLLPTVNSADGLWWTVHEDKDEPQPAEFDLPPPLAGIAAAHGAGYADLNFWFVGVPYVPGPAGPMFGGNVAALDYVFRLVGATQPVETGDDEPVEVHGDPDPPGSQ